MTADPMGELRQADRALRNAVDAMWRAATATIAAANAEQTPEPTDDTRAFLEANVRRISYPEIDYPQELRDQHNGPWPLPGVTELEQQLGLTRPLPPLLEFETPPCSICGEPTEYTDKTFRCDSCRCTWPRATAHLYPGTWDDPTADQCPDVLEDTDGLAIAQCIHTVGHLGDHNHPEFGEWVRNESEA